MQTLFLDTSGWIAALFKGEAMHAAASEVYHTVLQGGGRFVTTNLVIAETHALMLRRRTPPLGLDFLTMLERDAGHDVVFVDHELQRAAIDQWVRPLRDQRISLCDAMSFAVMRRRRLTRALALDRHFIVAGYEIL